MELLNQQHTLQSHVDELIQQATNIGMMINVKKTREMIIGRAVKVSIPQVVLNSESTHSSCLVSISVTT